MPTKLPDVLGYEPAFSTYDLNEMLAQRPKPRGFRLNSADRINRDYGPLAYDDPAATAFAAEQASRDGFAGINVNGADGYLESVVPDPTRIRREDAAFDPAQLDSANILYANSRSSGVPGAMIAEAADQPNDPVAEILRRYGLLSLSPGQAEVVR